MNTMFPGRPDYVGPQDGVFGLLHHEVLCETSRSVSDRVRYVEYHKHRREVPTRLLNMINLNDCPAAVTYGEAERAHRKASNELYETHRVAVDRARAEYYAKHNAVTGATKLDPDDFDFDEATQEILEKLSTAHNVVNSQLHIAWNKAEQKLIDDFKLNAMSLTSPIEAYIRQQYPGTAWNGTTLVFP